MHNINLIGFDDAEVQKFSAVLALAEFALNKDWAVSNDPNADIVINKKTPEKLSARQRKAAFFRFKVDGHSKPDDTIQHDEAYVPLVHDLIEKLNKINVISNTNNSDNRYSPQLLLQEIIDTDQCLEIALSNEQVFINPVQDLFYCEAPLEAFQHYFTEEAVSVNSIAEADLADSIETHQLSKQPLKHLIWYMAFSSSNGDLRPALSAADVVQLTEWPYLGTDSKDYIKLATYMKNKPCSLSEAIDTTGVKADIANNFYNACFLAKIIKTQQFTQNNLNNKPTDNLKFLKKLKNRLRR